RAENLVAMGNESSSGGGASSDRRQHPGGSSSAAGKAAPSHQYSVNRPIGSDSSPPQSNFNLHGNSAAANTAAAPASGSSSTADDGKHRIVVVNSGPRPDSAAVSDELRALGTQPTFMPLIKSSATSTGHALDSSASAAPAAERVDHRSLLHFCARYQEHLKQCAEAVAFDQNSLCGRIKELEAGSKSIHDSLQERHKKFQRLAEQIHKVTELRSMLTRMRSHAKHLGALMEELNSALPADCQLEPFSWQSTLPQQQQSDSSAVSTAAAASRAAGASNASTPSPANSLLD
ncbi:hypothetical protein BOX15_Mlig003993g4, partial [Macrostomum lignano]